MLFDGARLRNRCRAYARSGAVRRAGLLFDEATGLTPEVLDAAVARVRAGRRPLFAHRADERRLEGAASLGERRARAFVGDDPRARVAVGDALAAPTERVGTSVAVWDLAAAAVLGREPAQLDRANSYLAVMIDDLTLHGVSEPYRMPVSYTHLTLPTSDQCRSRWSPYH